jgi:8-oxo-dGTP pyrophosphatase MutT (NUDIX family)
MDRTAASHVRLLRQQTDGQLAFTRLMENIRDQLQSRLLQRQPIINTEWDAKPAAVLLPLYQDQDTWHLLFTRRTEYVESHRGQVSFPGGVIDSEDQSPTHAALREVQEEIGIHPNDVEVLGMLDPLLTTTQFVITPIVGVFPWPYDLRLNRDEVANVFGVSLDWLADKNNLEVRERDYPISGGSISVYYFKPYQGEIIWGATALITLNLLSLLKEP